MYPSNDSLPRPLRLELPLTAAPDVALASLRAISTPDIRVESVEGTRCLLSYGHTEPTHQVCAEVRPREDGSTVVVSYAGTHTSADGETLFALSIACLFCGLWLNGALLIAIGAFSLALQAYWRVRVAYRRRADFIALAGAIDRACTPFKLADIGQAYRALAPEPGLEDDPKGRRRRRAP